MIGLFVYVSLIILGTVGSQEFNSQHKGVELITQLTQALSAHHRLIVFFSDSNCEQCKQFSEIYTLMAEINSDISHFAKIQYTPDTSSIFTEYNIDAVPLVIAFQDSNRLDYPFEGFGTPQTLPFHLGRWIHRLWTPLPQYEKGQTLAHQLIVDCSNMIQFWQTIRKSELWLQIECGSVEILNKKLVLVIEEGEEMEGWRFSGEQSQTQSKLRKMIKAYKYKHVVSWSDAVAQQIFAQNTSAFIMIVNNETQSKTAYASYQKIKEKWYDQPSNYEPTLFTVADLSTHPQETTRLKKYLVGSAVGKSYFYWYPILAYLKPNGERYVCRWEQGRNQKAVEVFMEEVYAQLVLEKKESGYPLFRWLNENYAGGDQQSSKKVDEFQQKEQKDTSKSAKEKIATIKSIGEWHSFMEKQYSTPFFVYFTWRYDFPLVKLERELRAWWGSQEQLFSQKQGLQMKLHQVQIMDIPPFLGIAIEFLPTLIFVRADKSIIKLEGATDLKQIKQFIKQQAGQQIGPQSQSL